MTSPILVVEDGLHPIDVIGSSRVFRLAPEAL
jgi:hypothetical protein